MTRAPPPVMDGRSAALRRDGASTRVCQRGVGGALLAALAFLGACTSAEVGVSVDEIVGGIDDFGDPGVVVMIAQLPGSQSMALCTAEVISPRVLLTAAHCVHPMLVGANATFVVYPGQDVAQANQGNTLAVKEVHANPAWSASNLPAGHDSGVIILASPIAIAPLPHNRDAMTPAQKNQPVRFVGYGLTSAAARTSSGKKRQTSALLTDYDATKLFVADPANNTCSGDSGGPVFMTINGKETIVGITSYGDEACAQGGYSTRVDTELGFVEPYVLANDPPALPGANLPEPEGGLDAAPATGAAPTEEPADAGAARVRKPPAGDAGLPGCSLSSGAARSAPSPVALCILLCAFALRIRRRAVALR